MLQKNDCHQRPAVTIQGLKFTLINIELCKATQTLGPNPLCADLDSGMHQRRQAAGVLRL